MTIRNRLNSIQHVAYSLLLPLAITLMLTACNRMEPVYNVAADSAPATTQVKLSTKQVGDVIARVATQKGWGVDRTQSGVLRCTSTWLNHKATISITYSQHDYSIILASSENLNETDGNIHPKYNQRIKELQAEIDRQLAQAGAR